MDGCRPAPRNYFWQQGYDVQPYGEASAMVEACVGAYAQTIAMCPGDHWRLLDNGGRERVTNSALSRILRRPNDYQTISDFLLNLTRALYSRGEAFAVALRNDRGEIDRTALDARGHAADRRRWLDLLRAARQRGDRAAARFLGADPGARCAARAAAYADGIR